MFAVGYVASLPGARGDGVIGAVRFCALVATLDLGLDVRGMVVVLGLLLWDASLQREIARMTTKQASTL